MEIIALINTERPKLDINDKYLPEGSYSFIIKHFGDNGNITGIIDGKMYHCDSSNIKKAVRKHFSEQYTFKYYSVIQMMAKAQSQLARRARTISTKRIESLDYKSIPAYPSPSSVPGLMKNVVIENSDNSDEGSPVLTPTRSRISHNSFQLPNIASNNNFRKRRKSLSKCMICLNSNNLDKVLECGHKYHYQCIRRWYNDCEKTCPVCRAFISEI
tara:strand:- start:72 stop:716 length:645 start_codon:yes stop_codon:yes gene_type:complete